MKMVRVVHKNQNTNKNSEIYRFYYVIIKHQTFYCVCADLCVWVQNTDIFKIANL